jgi:hypothetical protein
MVESANKCLRAVNSSLEIGKKLCLELISQEPKVDSMPFIQEDNFL